MMDTAWMNAAGQDDVPTAFIIDKGGRNAWIGHPMSMDEPLEQIVNGMWDLRAAKARSRKEFEDRAERERLGDGLGLPAMTQRGLVEAIARCRDQVRLRPDDAGLYAEYGRLLGDLGRHDKAIEACRKAITLNRNGGGAHCILGKSLAAQGHLYDALTAFREAQRVEPAQSQSRRWQLRYRASCAAASAAAGKGKDGPPPNDAVKVKLRQQALNWLKANLSARKRAAMIIEPGNNKKFAEFLAGLKQLPDLASIRDEKELARLPEEERKEWQCLWADVEVLLKQTRGATP